MEDNHCALPSRTRSFILRFCWTDERSNSAAIEGNFSKLCGGGGEICCQGRRTRQCFALRAVARLELLGYTPALF
jgi:hypothetical protein